MEPEELARILKEMYEQSQNGQTALSVHLYGIRYANGIRRAEVSPGNLAKLAGIPESYGAEINKGINFSRFVHEI